MKFKIIASIIVFATSVFNTSHGQCDIKTFESETKTNYNSGKKVTYQDIEYNITDTLYLQENLYFEKFIVTINKSKLSNYHYDIEMFSKGDKCFALDKIGVIQKKEGRLSGQFILQFITDEGSKLSIQPNKKKKTSFEEPISFIKPESDGRYLFRGGSVSYLEKELLMKEGVLKIKISSIDYVIDVKPIDGERIIQMLNCIKDLPNIKRLN